MSTTTARALLTDGQFAAVRFTVMDGNPDMTEDTAGRITEEALKFVAACAMFPGEGLRPSRIVDEGWHSLLLHSWTYAELCQRLGRFVHHKPERPDPTRHDPAALDRTQARIVESGYEVDRTLWLAPTDETIKVGADCSHSGEGNCASCMDGGPN